MIPVEKFFTLLPRHFLARLAVDLEVNAPNHFRLPGEAVFLCLLNTLLNNPVVTQRLLEEQYQVLFGEHADHSSFGKRLDRLSPDYFEAIFRHLTRQLEPLPTHPPALRVRRADATTVTLSSKLLHFGLLQRPHGRAKNQTARRHLKAVFTLSEAALPDLLHVCTEQAECNDNQALGRSLAAANRPGDLWVFDRGCKDRDRLLALHQHDSYWLTPQCGQRLRVRRTVWACPDGPATLAVVQAGQAQAADQRPKDPAPSLLLRVEESVFENAEDAQHPTWQAKWTQMPLAVFHLVRYSRRTHTWEPFVLLTNLPLTADGQQAGPYSLAEVPELYRSRWDLEVFFKFLKQHLSYAHLTSFHENGLRLMLWMSLIAALLLHWYRQETGIDRGWRSVKFWLAQDTQAWAAAVLATVRPQQQRNAACPPGEWRRGA